jgi:hypothetical protein
VKCRVLQGYGLMVAVGGIRARDEAEDIASESVYDEGLASSDSIHLYPHLCFLKS